MEIFTFGMKHLRVTQNYYGTTSHKLHWYNSKDFADYPIDIAGENTSREVYYATVDMEVVAIKGIGNSTTNTIWLKSVHNVLTPSGTMHVFIALTHWNDNDPYIAKFKEGTVIKAGQPICYGGTDGASANHLHLVAGNADRGCGNGFIKNSNGKWVSTGYCMKPETIMYLDRNFTTELWGGSLPWVNKPETV